MKHLYVLLLLLSGLSSVHAQEEPPAPATPVVPTLPSTTTKDGLTITSIPIEMSDATRDIAAMLNTSFWRFKVKKPVGAPWGVPSGPLVSELRWRVELREADKAPILIKDGVSLLPEEAELTLGIMLDEGQSLQFSPMIKVYMGSRFMQNGARTSGGYKLPMREKNPVFGLKTPNITTSWGAPAKDDGTILLMDFETGKKEAPVKGEVVLVFNA